MKNRKTPPRIRRQVDLPRRSWIALAVLAAGLTSLYAQSPGGFSDASLQGAYSAQEKGDNDVSAGLGIVTYDGKGKTSRVLLVNAPSDDGGRRLIEFRAEGTYSINEDGTGTATYTNLITGGRTSEVTFDLVIAGARVVFLAGSRSKLATEVFAVQREAGVTVSLVTSTQKRLPD